MIKPAWIIPVEPAGQIYENHVLHVSQGRIAAIWPTAETPAGIDIIDLPGHVLVPGLVNAHTHAAMSLMRGLADDLPLMTWLNDHIWPAERKWVSPDFVRDGVQLAIAEMLRSGTTCFNDMYFFPDVAANTAAQAGIRAVTGLIVIDFPSAWAENWQDYIDKGIELHDELRNEALVHTAFAPHAPYSVSNAALKHIRVLSDELNIPVHMHVHETDIEIKQDLENHGVRPIMRLQQLGLLSPSLLAVHMTHLTDEDIKLAGENGCHVVHCPQSNQKLASGFCPVSRLLDAGINVALGTDGAASNNDLDMMAEMQSAALLAKAVSNNESALNAEQALHMATLAGARALGLEDEIGSLVPGKSADIVAIRLDQLETQPVYNPVSHIVYTADRTMVTNVWVAGRRVLKNRVLTTLDESALLDQARHWGERLRENA